MAKSEEQEQIPVEKLHLVFILGLLLKYRGVPWSRIIKITTVYVKY